MCTAVIDPQWDGLSAYVVEAGPNAPFAAPPGRAGGGQYSCVINGSVIASGESYGAQSLCWEAQSGEGLELTSGAEGCRMLFMRFPKAGG